MYDFVVDLFAKFGLPQEVAENVMGGALLACLGFIFLGVPKWLMNHAITPLYNKMKPWVQKELRHKKGQYTLGEIQELLDRREQGRSLSKNQSKALKKWDDEGEKLRASMPPMGHIRLPNISSLIDRPTMQFPEPKFPPLKNRD